MSEQSSERDEPDGPLSVPDEELPEDLRPGEDNPLAEPAGDDVPDDVVQDVDVRSDEDSADSQDSADSADSEDSQESASGDDES